MQPIVNLTLSLGETRELHRAMLTRYLMEDALRREQGLESVDVSPFVGRLETVLGISTADSTKQLERVEDDLWQHAWLSFTDEWAWHRARQEVRGELTPDELARFSPADIERAIEQRYEEKFDVYMHEVQLPGHEGDQPGDCVKRERLNANQKPQRPN